MISLFAYKVGKIIHSMETSPSPNPFCISYASPEERASFLRRAYLGFALMIVLWFGLDTLLLKLPLSRDLITIWFSNSSSWFIVIIGFLLLRLITRLVSNRGLHISMQIGALAACLILQSLLFAPILIMGESLAGSPFLLETMVMAGFLLLGVLCTAFTVRKDFSQVMVISQISICLISGLLACAWIWGIQEDWFLLLGIAAISGFAILHATLRIMNHQDTDEILSASLNLFASLSLLLWVSLRFIILRTR